VGSPGGPLNVCDGPFAFGFLLRRLFAFLPDDEPRIARQPPCGILHRRSRADPDLPVGQKSIGKNKPACPVEVRSHAPEAECGTTERDHREEARGQCCDAAVFSFSPGDHRSPGEADFDDHKLSLTLHYTLPYTVMQDTYGSNTFRDMLVVRFRHQEGPILRYFVHNRPQLRKKVS